MKTGYPLHVLISIRLILLVSFHCISNQADAQIKPPGYDREMEMRKAQQQLSPLDRDSITVTDTVIIFDPSTYQESTTITVTNYSLRDYCRNFLGMPDPDILLDRKPHTIVDPKNYGDMIIRLNERGKIDTIPSKNEK